MTVAKGSEVLASWNVQVGADTIGIDKKRNDEMKKPGDPEKGFYGRIGIINSHV